MLTYCHLFNCVYYIVYQPLKVKKKSSKPVGTTIIVTPYLVYLIAMGGSIRENFKANLKYYRKQKGLSQEKLSEIIGFGETYITELESRHKFPKPETIDLIAQKLEVEPYQLFIAPDQRDSRRREQEQAAIKSVAENLSARLSRLLKDKMLEEVSDTMKQENLILV